MRDLRASRRVIYALMVVIALGAAESALAIVQPTVCPNGIVVYDGVCPSAAPGSGAGQGACSVNGACSVTTSSDCSTKKGTWLGETSVCNPLCSVRAFAGHNTVPFSMQAIDHAMSIGTSTITTAFAPVQFSWSILNASGVVLASGASAPPALVYPLVVDGSVQKPLAFVPAASTSIPDGFSYSVRVKPGPDQLGRTCWSQFLPGGMMYSVAVQLPGLAVPPPGLAASVSNGVALTWKAVDPALYAVSDYTIARSSASNGPWTVVASRVNATSYTVPAGSLGGVFYFAVASQNQTGIGPYSAPISVSLPPTMPVVTATTATTSTATNGVVDVSWTASMGATSYAVQVSANGGPYTTKQTVSATKATLSGLTVGTSYNIVVAANATTGTTRSAPVTWVAKKYLLQ